MSGRDRRLSAMREVLRRRLVTPGVNLTRAEHILEAMRAWAEPINVDELRELFPDIPASVLTAAHGPLHLLIAEGRIARIRRGVFYADPDLAPTLTGRRLP